jgi:hypothetical protein
MSAAPTPNPANTLPTKKLVTMVAGMILVPVIFLGGYALLQEGSKSTVTGTITLGEGEAMSPDRCESGVLSKDAPATRAQWHGVDLFEAARPTRRVRLIDDPEKGKIVTVRFGEDAPIVIDRASCTQFAFEVRETGQMIFDHYGLEGTIDVVCPGLTVKAKFASCYDGT